MRTTLCVEEAMSDTKIREALEAVESAVYDFRHAASLDVFSGYEWHFNALRDATAAALAALASAPKPDAASGEDFGARNEDAFAATAAMRSAKCAECDHERQWHMMERNGCSVAECSCAWVNPPVDEAQALRAMGWATPAALAAKDAEIDEVRGHAEAFRAELEKVRAQLDETQARAGSLNIAKNDALAELATLREERDLYAAQVRVRTTKADEELAALRQKCEEAERTLATVADWRCIGPDAPSGECRVLASDLDEMCVGCAAHVLAQRALTERDRADAAEAKVAEEVAKAEERLRGLADETLKRAKRAEAKVAEAERLAQEYFTSLQNLRERAREELAAAEEKNTLLRVRAEYAEKRIAEAVAYAEIRGRRVNTRELLAILRRDAGEPGAGAKP